MAFFLLAAFCINSPDSVSSLVNFAEDIATRWIALNEKVFKATGRMMEKYNVLDTHAKAGGGEYPGQDGFGWTNGVYLKLIGMYPNKKQ